jgi:hypothetical protein
VSNETDLETLLKPLVGNRVSEDTFPQPPAVPVWPAIRYSFSTSPIVDSCGDGEDDTAEREVQIDVVASERTQIRALRLSVRALMKTYTPPAICLNDFPLFDPDTKTFRRVMIYLLNGSSS